jgi:hypothetical protein
VSLDELPFSQPEADATRPERPPRRHRHQWVPGWQKSEPSYRWTEERQWPDDVPRFGCRRCGLVRDDVRSRLGRTNRSRGNAIEREVGKLLGLRRVGQYGGPDDLSGDLFAVQVKSGGSFPERLWTWLRAVPTNAGQTPLLVVTDAPGPGHRRRAVVVVALEDWIALHGEAT